MSYPRSVPVSAPWALLGLVAGVLGLAVSYAVEMFFTLHRPLLSVVAAMAGPLVPGHAHDVVVKYLGLHDRSLFLVLLVLAGGVLCAWGGASGRTRWWSPIVAYTGLAAVAGVAIARETNGSFSHWLPLGVGWLVAVALWGGLRVLLRRYLADRAAVASAGQQPSEEVLAQARTSRRTLLGAVGVVVVTAGAGGLVAQQVGSSRRRTAATRTLVRLPAMSRGLVPPAAHSVQPGANPWRTNNADFFVRNSALRTPTVDPTEWSLRIHGLVRTEVQISYAVLVAMPLTERWVTLVCAENEVGGRLAGNAWWTGVLVKDVLARAGVDAAAQTVVQTAADGWQCRTPLAALLNQDALLAFGMNGEVLPIEHGFPVRTVVPGALGDASACKWVVDLEVVGAEPSVPDTEEPEPEPLLVPWAARIDVAQADVLVGTLWGTDPARARVQVSVNYGPWRNVEQLPGATPSVGVWRQFEHPLALFPGEHSVRARALGPGGTPSEPHEVEVSVPAED